MDHLSPKKPEKTTDASAENTSPAQKSPAINQEKENILTPKKEPNRSEPSEFKTPEKSGISPNFKTGTAVGRKEDENVTPRKPPRSVDLESDLKVEASCDGEEGMISTTEQARLLIAASKTPSKSMNKTPVKQNTPSGKRPLDASPCTPGKYRRVELITLSSPKTKRLKQI